MLPFGVNPEVLKSTLPACIVPDTAPNQETIGVGLPMAISIRRRLWTSRLHHCLGWGRRCSAFVFSEGIYLSPVFGNIWACGREAPG